MANLELRIGNYGQQDLVVDFSTAQSSTGGFIIKNNTIVTAPKGQPYTFDTNTILSLSYSLLPTPPTATTTIYTIDFALKEKPRDGPLNIILPLVIFRPFDNLFISAKTTPVPFQIEDTYTSSGRIIM